jgi:hypothetical protein
MNSFWNTKVFAKVKGEANRPNIWNPNTGTDCCNDKLVIACCKEEYLRTNFVSRELFKGNPHSFSNPQFFGKNISY